MITKMSDKDYFALKALNNSTLSRLAKCPAAMQIEIEQTPQMSLGSAAHVAILEGSAAFLERFVVMPKVDGRTKEGKAAREAVIAGANGKTVVTDEDVQHIFGMAESVISHPTAKDLIKSGNAEMAVTWEMEGVHCKAKADWLGDCLVDLKTTQDATEYTFQRTIINSRYHNQMAWYYDGLKANLRAVKGVYIIAVEQKPPYTCGVYKMTDELLEWGTACYMPLLRQYKECVFSNEYPSYQNGGAVEVYPPAWAGL